MREQLVSSDVAARKAYLASIVDAVIVSENKIRIMGSNDNIRSTFGPKGQPTPVVRKSVQEWCPGRNRKVSKTRYFIGFWRWFDSGLLTCILTLPMFGRVAECGAMCCGEKVTFRSDRFDIFWGQAGIAFPLWAHNRSSLADCEMSQKCDGNGPFG